MKRLFFMVLGLGLLFCAMTSAAQAQATRTWVSGLGDDANPCSRTAPCKTFPGAYSKTAVGGEIDVIDPGGFGTITISKSLTIDGGGGVMASILGSSTNGAVINGAAADDIIFRNITFQGISDSSFPGISAIVFNSGRMLTIEHCVIENWSQYGVTMATTAATKMSIRDSTFDHLGIAGVQSSSTSGVNAVSFSYSAVHNSANGLQAHGNVSFQVNNSTIANNTAGDGVLADGGINSSMTVEASTLTENNVGAHAINNGTVRIGRNAITHNNTGVLSVAPGKVFSWVDNHIAGNAVNGTPDLPNLAPL